jgi:Domain of unknown function (DUF4271)
MFSKISIANIYFCILQKSMIKRLFFLGVLIFVSYTIYAQGTSPTTNNINTTDTLKVDFQNRAPQLWPIHNWVPANAPPQKVGISFSKKNNDGNFYLGIAIVAFFAIFKLIFPKYVADLFSLMFKSTVKSKQLRDQLETSKLPSVLLNIFFCIVIGVLGYIIFLYYNPNTDFNKFLLLLVCIGFVGIVYLVKFVTLLFFGWLFNAKEAVANYIFTVFYFNKIMSILLLPLVIFMLLQGVVSPVWLTIALFFLAIILLYRYFLSYVSLQKITQMNQLHFFLYLCAVEVAPLLLIYKGLMLNYSKLL